MSYLRKNPIPVDHEPYFTMSGTLVWPCEQPGAGERTAGAMRDKRVYYINEPSEELLKPGGVNVASFVLYCDLPWILI